MFGIKINRNLDLSLIRQICDQLRNLIEKNRLKSGEKLPSTRQMAEELKISRNVMIEVYEQLIAEGYLESQIGSGTYVTENIIQNKYSNNDFADIMLKIDKQEEIDNDIIHFAGGIPDLRSFPRKLWSKYYRLAIEDSPDNLFDYGDITGDYELKQSLTDYIFRIKGIQCHPEQIIIISGSSEGFLLIAKVFSKTNNIIYVEDPTVSFIRSIFNNLKYNLHPLKVEQDGMEINQLIQNNESRLILVTPSHQFPTGSVLSIQKRQQLIKIAETTDNYLIEDDYDSEFRLKGIPIPPIQVLNPTRVIYVSTFSKNMYPGLRLGFLIVPPKLLENFYQVKTMLNIRTSTIKQRAMANFIKNGHLDRHIYNMKKIYKNRRSLLTRLLKNNFKDNVAIHGDETGMHLQAEFLPEEYCNINWNCSVKYGVKVHSFEEYSIEKCKNRNRIVLGYGNLNTTEIKIGIKKLYNFLTNVYFHVL